ncbi:MAG: sugar phosphate isomerase/epimerase, partial [bacterium]|nr:sugar phosphate isomerase/epimerase [bacterium]
DYAELKESREILKRLIDIGEKLDSRRFIFHLLLPRETEHLEKWILESIETFKILEKENDSEKIFCFENVFEPSTNLFDDIFLNFKMSIPNTFRCLDLGHSNVMYGKEGTITWLQSMNLNEIRQVHIHDNKGKLDEHLPLGWGNIDFKEIFQIFNRQKIFPLITVENFDKQSLEHSLIYVNENL